MPHEVNGIYPCACLFDAPWKRVFLFWDAENADTNARRCRWGKKLSQLDRSCINFFWFFSSSAATFSFRVGRACHVKPIALSSAASEERGHGHYISSRPGARKRERKNRRTSIRFPEPTFFSSRQVPWCGWRQIIRTGSTTWYCVMISEIEIDHEWRMYYAINP